MPSKLLSRILFLEEICESAIDIPLSYMSDLLGTAVLLGTVEVMP